MSGTRRKLIEVALPLEAINTESAREKSIRHGHPSTLHLWWSRKPLATCRAVVFASLVDDPSAHPERFPSESDQAQERRRLFGLMSDLVKWESLSDERVLARARAEIAASTNGKPPAVFDPFCGGGSIPLEAQRLGLQALGSDLNPVAVLITKALVEIPPRFAGKPPVNPDARKGTLISAGWTGTKGLAEDVQHYGQWMRDEAERRIGTLYPKVKVPKEQGGGEATVIAWLWARTVKCPNPACGASMLLTSKWAVSTKRGKEAHVVPTVKGASYRLEVRTGGTPPPAPKVGRGAKFKCLCCDQVAADEHIRGEFQAGRGGDALMAIAAEGKRGRIYVTPTDEHIAAARKAKPTWAPTEEMNRETSNLVSGRGYGIKQWSELFTPRQLLAMSTFSDLVSEARERVLADARAGGLRNDPLRLEDGGAGAAAYADAVATYLAFALDKCADYWNTIATWVESGEFVRNCFARQAIPMTWDFAEVCPFSTSTANFMGAIEWVSRSVATLPASGVGNAEQRDATVAPTEKSLCISTDPPYYHYIGYADLSDFFYAWLRPTLRQVFPKLLSTIQVPKDAELVASPHRFGGDTDKARDFFELGLGRAFERMREAQDPRYPLTVYYAFKQAETEGESGEDGGDSHASTGWETMLEGLLKARFSINGTWPMRTERGARSNSIGTSALASSIVLVCRPRPHDAPTAMRSDLLRALKRELPVALRQLQQGNIAPVDLAQAAIGPGMAIFSRYARVLDTKGEPVRVREALGLINQVLDEVLAEQEGDFDADTRWALAWFDQAGFEEGKFGEAETLSKAKNTSVAGLVEAGILHSKAGRVRLLKPEELPANWDPVDDGRLTVWEATHHMIRVLTSSGESAAGSLAAKLGAHADVSRELAYRLYSMCERRKRAPEATAYNSLVQSWPEIARLAQSNARGGRSTEQGEMFEGALSLDKSRDVAPDLRSAPKRKRAIKTPVVDEPVTAVHPEEQRCPRCAQTCDSLHVIGGYTYCENCRPR